MKIETKRILALLMSVLLVIGMALPVCAGDEGVTGGNATVWIIVGVILVVLLVALGIVQKMRKNSRDE